MLKRSILIPRVASSQIWKTRIIPLQLRKINIIGKRFKYNSTALWKYSDSKHFFSKPNENGNNSNNNEMNSEILKTYRRMQNRKKLQTGLIILNSLLITIIGYQVIYKVIYLKQNAFIVIGPSPYKVHKLSDGEEKHIDIPNLKKVVKSKVIEKIIRNDFIKEEYGVPLKLDMITDDSKEEFKIWVEDEIPVIYGFKLKPYNKRNSSKNWHNFIYLFHWRFSARSINIIQIMDNFRASLGLDYERITIPEAQYDAFKNENPIHDYDDDNDDNNDMNRDRVRHFCFIGEFAIDDRSNIVYKGKKYHVESKIDEIYLMRKESNKFIKYLLYNEN